MSADVDGLIRKAYFISPIVDMEKLTSIDIMTAFAQAHHASLTILDGGDHWFHTDAQIQFLDHWIRDKSDY